MPKRNLSTKTWIDVNDEEEIEFWAKRFHVTPKEVLEAVKAVGKTVKYVELHFERKVINRG